MNKQNLNVQVLKKVVESVVKFIDRELDIKRIQTSNQEKVEECLKKDLCKSI